MIKKKMRQKQIKDARKRRRMNECFIRYLVHTRSQDLSNLDCFATLIFIVIVFGTNKKHKYTFSSYKVRNYFSALRRLP